MAQIRLGDDEFEISRLTLRQLKQYLHVYKKIATLSKQDPEMIDAAAELISGALIKKYPSMTADEVLDLEGVTSDQMNTALMTIATEAGLVTSGEMKPLVQQASSSGIESTDSSQLPADTLTQ